VDLSGTLATFGYNLYYDNASRFCGQATASGKGDRTSDPLLDEPYCPPRFSTDSLACGSASATYLLGDDR